mmetsp:Transcript_13524/g.34018  ORF Transcript_13524/g.34018 Transcript_13524/m.34018 type:complete len:227 (+) Transcript_13524:381-1061(+)
MHGLHEPQAAALDGLDVLVLLLVRVRVLLLQPLHVGLEALLQLRHFRLLLLDHLLTLRRAECHELLNLRLLRVIAEVDVRRTALRAQAFRECLQGREVPAALVFLEVVRITKLDGRVATDANLVAKSLSARRAVHIRDHSRSAVLEVSGQLVPIGLHTLAVASPWRLELHEHALACHGIFPRLLGELTGGGRPEQDRAHGKGDAEHGAGSQPGQLCCVGRPKLEKT